MPKPDQRCKVCDLPLIAHYSWMVLGIRPEGHAPRGSRALSLCRNHFQQHLRAEKRKIAPPPPRPKRGPTNRPLAETVEEYLFIRDSVDSVAEAAARMGMSHSALDRALYRARKAGNRRALPPLAQLERAIHNGSGRHLIQEAS